MAADDEATVRRAADLSRRLGLPLATETPRSDAPQLCLRVRADRLELLDASAPRQRPIFVDFLAGPIAQRRVGARGKREPIARAVGDRPRHPRVVDATAGLARDAFLLAALGYEVTAVERSPVLAAMIEDAICRATAAGNASLMPARPAMGSDQALAAALSRLRIVTADSIDYLSQLEPAARPEVVYLDPMYETSQGSALAKKEMRILRKLVGDDPDAAELLCVAQRTATRRVVVKRHRHAPPLGNGVSHAIYGTRVRYDVYTRGQNEESGDR